MIEKILTGLQLGKGNKERIGRGQVRVYADRPMYSNCILQRGVSVYLCIMLTLSTECSAQI